MQAIEGSDVVSEATPTEALPTKTGEQDSASQFHIKTKSEKKEAKKEKERRQKELKKQSKQADKGDIETPASSTSNPNNDESVPVDDSVPATCDPDPPNPPLPTVELPSANDPLISSTQTIEDDVGQEDEDDKDDDKKKKKKKKKKAEKEEDKKSAKVYDTLNACFWYRISIVIQYDLLC